MKGNVNKNLKNFDKKEFKGKQSLPRTSKNGEIFFIIMPKSESFIPKTFGFPPILLGVYFRLFAQIKG